MTATEHQEDDDVMATINIIPFVDIVLVLLIVFMVTSATIVRASYKLDLPKAASAGEQVTSSLNLVMTREGEIFVDGAPITREALVALVESQAQQQPELQAVIAADKGAEYGSVIALIDLVKQHGVSGFALNIERDPSAGSTSTLPRSGESTR